MQAKRLIPNSYLRWRHGRGFGIHSPFAYNFICLTLRERLPYYAYPVLREELRRSGADMSYHDLGLIFRIVTRFMPESVAIFGDNNAGVERTAVTAVSEHITLQPVGFICHRQRRLRPCRPAPREPRGTLVHSHLSQRRRRIHLSRPPHPRHPRLRHELQKPQRLHHHHRPAPPPPSGLRRKILKKHK